MKIALLGYGKMGRAIEEIALQKNHEIVLRIKKDNAAELTQASLQKSRCSHRIYRPAKRRKQYKKMYSI